MVFDDEQPSHDYIAGGCLEKKPIQEGRVLLEVDQVNELAAVTVEIRHYGTDSAFVGFVSCSGSGVTWKAVDPLLDIVPRNFLKNLFEFVVSLSVLGWLRACDVFWMMSKTC